MLVDYVEWMWIDNGLASDWPSGPLSKELVRLRRIDTGFVKYWQIGIGFVDWSMVVKLDSSRIGIGLDRPDSGKIILR